MVDSLCLLGERGSCWPGVVFGVGSGGVSVISSWEGCIGVPVGCMQEWQGGLKRVGGVHCAMRGWVVQQRSCGVHVMAHHHTYAGNCVPGRLCAWAAAGPHFCWEFCGSSRWGPQSEPDLADSMCVSLRALPQYATTKGGVHEASLTQQIVCVCRCVPKCTI